MARAARRLWCRRKRRRGDSAGAATVALVVSCVGPLPLCCCMLGTEVLYLIRASNENKQTLYRFLDKSAMLQHRQPRGSRGSRSLGAEPTAPAAGYPPWAQLRAAESPQQQYWAPGQAPKRRLSAACCSFQPQDSRAGASSTYGPRSSPSPCCTGSEAVTAAAPGRNACKRSSTPSLLAQRVS